MRRWKQFIGLAILAGLILWFFDALLDSILLAEQPFLDTLFLDIPLNKLFHRLITCVGISVLLFLLLIFLERGRRAKEALKTERDKAQLYFNVAGVMLLVIGSDRKVQLINNRGCEILGYNEEEIIGKNWFDNFLPKAIHKEIEAVFDQLMADDVETVEYHENPVLSRSGEERVIAWHNTILKDPDGNIVGTLSSGVDITERKRAEEALRESEEKYRFLFEDSPTINLVIGMDGKIINTNTAVSKVTGYSRDEIRGGDVMGFIAEEDREASAELLMKSYLGEYTPDVDIRIIAKDGSIRTILFSQGNVVLHENEQPTGILVTGIDITERKRAEEALHKEKGFTESVVASLPGMFYLFDENGTMLRWNKNFEKVSGYSGKEIAEMNVFDFFTGEDKEIMEDRVTEVFKKGESTAEAFFISKDEKRTPHFFTGLRTQIGDVRYLVGMGIDITERRRAEEKVKAALREKEVLLREVHHRVKNNLQIINSLLSLEAAKQTDTRTVSAFRDSQNRIRTMAHIHEMLYQAKDIGRIELAGYLEDIVRSIFISYAADAGRIDHKLDVGEIRIGIDTAIPLGLIVNELVSNSIEHAFPDATAGRIRVKVKEEKDGGIILDIADNGAGLPEDIDIQTTNTMGLQLVRMMVEQLEGKLEIKRRNGTGFRITFPG